jgi:glycosyltransferase involved in cell wall biosynthesis
VLGGTIQGDYRKAVKKIAYITERRLDSKITGAITRDFILLKIIKKIGEVTLYYANTEKYHKYEYICNNRHTPEIIGEINNIQYDVVVVSAYQTSPFLLGYRNIRHRKIFYLCDSYFHMRKTVGLFSVKRKIMSGILAQKERAIIRHELCTYLGYDEIESLPVKYRKNAIIFPFHISAKSRNYFIPDGHVVYVGEFAYWTNRDALRKILRIAPRVSFPIKIVGPNIPRLSHVPENIDLAGYVESLDDAYIGARALIYPIPYGTGIKNKVIEAMSYGIPVIGFRNAFTNMSVESNKNVIIVNSITEMINALQRTDLGIISENAYSFIKQEMSEEYALSCIRRYI